MFLNRHDSFRQNMDHFNGRGEQIEIGETSSFGSLAKGQKKYGATSNRKLDSQASIQGFEYLVKTGDTLQGLAIKFGITTEQIRRANQLWTNDSLFLREKLLIPCEGNQILCNNSNSNGNAGGSVSSSPGSSHNGLEHHHGGHSNSSSSRLSYDGDEEKITTTTI